MSSSMYKNVLVTGGWGFVGQNLQEVRPDWTYLRSSQYDLRDPAICKQMIAVHKPDAVIHLASKVGGILYNMENQAEIFHDNILINTNLLEACKKTGVTRVLACLSTCAWPNEVVEYPMSEADILKGPPQESNLSYAYSKRLLYLQCKAYRENFGLNYSCFAPANIYGPHMERGMDGHFIGVLLDKIENAEQDGTISLMGSGSPKRQQVYVTDLVNLIPRLLDRHHSAAPLIVAPDENCSIKQFAEQAIIESGKNLGIEWTGGPNGQWRKDCSSAQLRILLSTHGGVHFTPFSEGIKETMMWSYENA